MISKILAKTCDGVLDKYIISHRDKGQQNRDNTFLIVGSDIAWFAL